MRRPTRAACAEPRARPAASLLAVLVLAGHAAGAGAVATFDGTGSLTLEITGIALTDEGSVAGPDNVLDASFDVIDDGLPFTDTLGTGAVDPAPATAGSASVGGSGPLGLGDVGAVAVGDPIALAAAVAGSASLPDGFAFAIANPVVDLLLLNVGPDPDEVFTVSFGFTYEAATAGGPPPVGAPPPFEEAAVDVFALVEHIDLGAAGPSVVVLDEAFSSDGLLGPPTSGGPVTGSFDVLVAVGGGIVTADLEASGFADAEVAEPAPAGLLGAGALLALLGRRRRAPPSPSPSP